LPIFWSSAIRGKIQGRLQQSLGGKAPQVLQDKGDGLVLVWLKPKIIIQDKFGAAWNLSLLPVSSTARSYWFDVQARFEGGRDKEFRSATILLASGLKADDPLPLARAECDVVSPDHAQPHWHIYADGKDLPTRGTERLHWAMAAQWGKLPNSHSTELEDEDQLVNWLGGCTAYLIHQLSYVESKLPKSPNPFDKAAS
jgi:hypothetical protein